MANPGYGESWDANVYMQMSSLQSDAMTVLPGDYAIAGNSHRQRPGRTQLITEVTEVLTSRTQGLPQLDSATPPWQLMNSSSHGITRQLEVHSRSMPGSGPRANCKGRCGLHLATNSSSACTSVKIHRELTQVWRSCAPPSECEMGTGSKRVSPAGPLAQKWTSNDSKQWKSKGMASDEKW